MTQRVSKSYDGVLSNIIKQALDAGFTDLSYAILASGSIATILMLTSGHSDDSTLSYFRDLLLALSLAPIMSIIYGCFRVSTAIIISRPMIGANSKNEQPPSA
jgi:hypothetical protein